MASFLGIEVMAPAPFDSIWGEFLLIMLLWILTSAWVLLLVDVILKAIVKNTKTTLDDDLFKIVRSPIFFLIMLYGFFDTVSTLLGANGSDGSMWLLYNIIQTLVLLWVVYKVFNVVVIGAMRMVAIKKKNNMEKTVIPVLNTLGKAIILLFGFMILMGFMGVNASVLVASMGILGLVIAFAAQDTLSNFFSGIHLMLDKPFMEGETLELENGNYCEIVKVGLRSTQLYDTFEHKVMYIPNSQLSNQTIVNLNLPDDKLKKIRFDVAYDSDIETVKKIIQEAALRQPKIMKDEKHYPFVRFVEMKDSAITFRLFSWVGHFDDQWKTSSDIREDVLLTFRKENVEIPFPQRVLYMNNEE